jgi:hypothetical protein
MTNPTKKKESEKSLDGGNFYWVEKQRKLRDYAGGIVREIRINSTMCFPSRVQK